MIGLKVYGSSLTVYFECPFKDSSFEFIFFNTIYVHKKKKLDLSLFVFLFGTW